MAWPRLWQNNRGQVINSRLLKRLLGSHSSLRGRRQEIYFRLIGVGLTAAMGGCKSCDVKQLSARPSVMVQRRRGAAAATVPAMTGLSPGHTSARHHMAPSSPCHFDVNTATHSFVLISVVLVCPSPGERSTHIRRWFLVAFCLV